jgi:hypothetical protein
VAEHHLLNKCKALSSNFSHTHTHTHTHTQKSEYIRKADNSTANNDSNNPIYKWQMRAKDVALIVLQCWPSRHKALGSIPSTINK